MFSDRTQQSLQTETTNSLVLCGSVLFACGLLCSPALTDSQVIRGVLLVASAIGGVSLAWVMVGMRHRLTATRAIEKQLHSLAEGGSSTSSTSQLHPILARTPISQGWNGIIRRVEDRKLDEEIERRLQQSVSSTSTERYARAIRSLQEGLVISDAEGTISYANPAWMALLGMAREDECDGTGGSIVNELEAIGFTNWEEDCHSLLHGAQPLTLTLNKGHSVQEGVLLLVRIPLEGRANEASGFVWTLRDITQASLARAVHEQFLSSATHELRTPLTNIRAYTESLLDMKDIDAEQQKEFFNVINSESRRLSRLLNQLLDIQQLEAGSMTIQPTAFDVHRMVEEIQEHISPLVQEKELDFASRIAPNLKTIHADKEKLTSCLVNLLGNAIKYTSAKGEIRLRAEQDESYVTISVEDNGFGIAEEELPRIFERFYRCQDERVSELEGNGLGLSFCMEVARQHCGELTVESQLDKGSRFILRIPVTGQRSGS